MNNQRGSALLNVLAVVATLLILGFGLMQAINSDAILAIRDADVTHAIQMAEGGVDYGLEMLISGPEEALGELNWPGEGSGQPFFIEVEEGDVEVTVEEIVPEKEFLITSRSQCEKAVRQIKAWVTHYGDIANPFSYSLFVGGGEEEDPEAEWDLVLKNLTIHGSVYIASKRVLIDDVKFNGDVHFASNYVYVAKGELNQLQAKATREEFTVVEEKHNNPNHWANKMEVVSDIQDIPDVNIDELQSVPGFTKWTSDTVYFSQLDRLNYFDGDVTIKFNNNHPTEVKMVVACTGNVTFFNDQGQYNPDINRTLIVMAEEDVIGVERISTKATNKPKVDLYLYSKGSIHTEQNIYPSSIMAEWISVHNQNYTVQAPNPAVFDDLPDELRKAWDISGYRITRWEN